MDKVVRPDVDVVKEAIDGYNQAIKEEQEYWVVKEIMSSSEELTEIDRRLKLDPLNIYEDQLVDSIFSPGE